MNTVWILIFVVANNTMNSGASTVTVEFSSKEACQATQEVLLQQSKIRVNHVLLNVCAKK